MECMCVRLDGSEAGAGMGMGYEAHNPTGLSISRLNPSDGITTCTVA